MIVFGLLFGLVTAFPAGVQSFVLMNQGLRFGYPRVLSGIITAPARLWMRRGSGVMVLAAVLVTRLA